MTEPTADVISPDSTTIKGIHHVGLSVSNLEESLTFYQSSTALELTGTFRINKDDGAEKAAGFLCAPQSAAVLKGPNAYLELNQPYASANNI